MKEVKFTRVYKILEDMRYVSGYKCSDDVYEICKYFQFRNGKRIDTFDVYKHGFIYKHCKTLKEAKECIIADIREDEKNARDKKKADIRYFIERIENEITVENAQEKLTAISQLSGKFILDDVADKFPFKGEEDKIELMFGYKEDDFSCLIYLTFNNGLDMPSVFVW